jgi:hypothetical protein
MKAVNVASCKEDANESKIINEKYHNHTSTLNRYASHMIRELLLETSCREHSLVLPYTWIQVKYAKDFQKR